MIEPYCGAAPQPADWLQRWNLDPGLLAGMAAMAGLHLFLLWRAPADGRAGRFGMAFAAWFILVALFVSPLCALTSALFSARLAHHVVLVALVPPLFILSMPERWRAPADDLAPLGMLAFVGHTAILWLWHAPGPYAAALGDARLFWAMELSLLLSAMLLWSAVLSRTAKLGATLGILLGSVVQMGLLGAAITFARAPLYAAHFMVTEPWGLSAIEDQQLAGLLMWVPASLAYLGAALVILAGRMRAGVTGDAFQ